jgi:hypothetical protein
MEMIMERDYVYVVEQWFDSYEYLGIVGAFAARGLAERAVAELDGEYIYRIQAVRLGVIEDAQEVE